MTDDQFQSAAPLHAGDKLGKFTLVEQIATGSHGDVWKGYDELLGAPVSIKHLIIDDSQGDADAQRERFRAESRLLGQLPADDKYLARFIDFMDDPRGLFIVTQFIDGVSLEQVLGQRTGPIDLNKALVILRNTARALQTIHAAGIIHRDLKPANIMIPRDGGVKLCDFGLASLLADQDAMSEGSARYMAPELFGDQPADTRADIYSLGIISYEMVVGRARFNETFRIIMRDPRNESLRWMKWHTNLRVTAPPLEKIEPNAPQPLRELIARMMEKDPASRIGSADQVLEVIRRHFTVEGQSRQQQEADLAATAAPLPAVDTTAPTAPLPQTIKMRRLGEWIVTAAVLIVALLGAIGYKISADRREVRQARQAVNEQLNAAHVLFKQGKYQEAQDRFAATGAGLDRNDSWWLKCKAMRLLCQARIDYSAGHYDQALKAATDADNLKAIRQRDLIQKLKDLIYQEQAFVQVLAKIDQTIDDGQIDLARSLLHEQRRREDHLTDGQESRLDELGAKLEAQIALHWEQQVLNEAAGLVDDGRLADAIDRLNVALQRESTRRLKEKFDEYRDTQKIDQLIIRADRAEQRDLLGQAVTHLASAVKLRRNDPLAVRLRSLKGRVEYARGQKLEARGRIDQATEVYLRASGFGNAQANKALTRLRTTGQINKIITAGDRAMDQGEFETAISHFKRAIAMGADTKTSTRLKRARIKLALIKAGSALRDGDLKSARNIYNTALQIDPYHVELRRKLGNVKRLANYIDLRGQGDTQRNKGNLAKAKRLYRRARKGLDEGDAYQHNEIKARLDETEYEHLIAQARSYIEIRKWQSARALLIAAERKRPSERVQELITEVTKKMKQESEY